VKARDGKQADVLFKATLLGSHPAHVHSYVSLNSSREVIYTVSFDGMSEEGIQSAFAEGLHGDEECLIPPLSPV
jgi:hypothetical protein